MSQNAPQASVSISGEDVASSTGVLLQSIASTNGYFNFNTGTDVDFSSTPAEIVVNDQASSNVDENLTFNPTLLASDLSGAFLYKQTDPNASGGVLNADEITLKIDAAGYSAFKSALWTQLKESATGDNGVAIASSLGDYVVGLIAWSVFGNYRAVAPIVNDQELTDHVDGLQATVADKVAKALVTFTSGDLEANNETSFNKNDVSGCPMGDVLTTMIKYHPDRFTDNDVSDFKGIPFRAGDVIEFTVTLTNLKVVESNNTSSAYLKAEKSLPYDAKINTDGYLIGGVNKAETSPDDRKWVVGCKMTLQ